MTKTMRQGKDVYVCGGPLGGGPLGGMPLCGGEFFCTWCLFSCFFRLLGSEKRSAHTEQEYGLSPVWMCRWIFRFQNWENFFPQTLHPYGLSPVCVLR